MDGEEAESRSGGTAGKGSGTYRARRSPRVRPVEQRCRAPGAGGAAGQVRSGPEVPPPPPAPVPPPHPRKRKRSAWGAALSVGTDRHRAATTPRSSSFHSNLNTDQKERKKTPQKQNPQNEEKKNQRKNRSKPKRTHTQKTRAVPVRSTAQTSLGCCRGAGGGPGPAPRLPCCRDISRRRPRTFDRAPGFRSRGSGGEGRSGHCIRAARSPPGNSQSAAAALAWLAGAPARLAAEREQ